MRRSHGIGYYGKIIIACLVTLLLLLCIQCIYEYHLLSTLTVSHSAELSEHIVRDLEGDIFAWLNNLDRQLDKVYAYPEILGKLNAGSTDKQEEPARSLLAQTDYFSSLLSVRLYNRNHIMKSFYTRSNIHGKATMDIYAQPNDDVQQIRDFIDNDTTRVRLFCLVDTDGNSYLRFVKRIYQDKGYTFAGYIVCDLKPLALSQIVADVVQLDDRYVWIASNEGSCWLSVNCFNEAYEIMQNMPTASAGAWRTEKGNYYRKSKANSFGISVTLFTDEILLHKQRREMLKALILEVTVSAGIALLLAAILTHSVHTRTQHILSVLKSIEQGKTSLRLPCRQRDELDTLCAGFNSLLDGMELVTREEAKARKAFEEARYHSLQAQVNPHFLYNTLENISAIASAQGCDTVDGLCIALSHMLRYSIETDLDGRCVTIQDELDYVHRYMTIMDVRTCGDIQLTEEISGDVFKLPLPRLSIQPLVENAIRHGLKNRREGKCIRILSRKTPEGIELIVEDNGGAADIDEMNAIIEKRITKTSRHTSIGISNIHERIQLCFGYQYGLRAEADEEHTRLIISIPADKVEAS